MVDDEKFSNVTGYGGAGVSHMLIENQYGVTSVEFETFKQKTIELASAIRATQGDYLRILHEADPALRVNLANGALRALMAMMLDGGMDAVSSAQTMRRVHQFVISYRRIADGDDKSWGDVLD